MSPSPHLTSVTIGTPQAQAGDTPVFADCVPQGDWYEMETDTPLTATLLSSYLGQHHLLKGSMQATSHLSSMFGHLPLRSKNDCHSPVADFYDMTQKRRPSFVRACSSDYFNSPCRTEDAWDRAFPRSSLYGLDPFRNEHDLPHPPRSVPLDIHYKSSPRSGYGDHGRPFEKAAADLYAVLKHADTELRTMHKAFTSQISGLSLWLPAHYADMLWSVYTDWDGHPVDQQSSSKTPKLNTSFHTLTNRIAKASDAIKQSAPPSSTPTEKFAFLGSHPDMRFSSSFPENVKTTEYGNWSWDNIRSATRKLQISLDTIDELMGAVRQQRQKIGSLVREIVGAKQLLEGMREVWDIPMPSSQKGGKEKVRDTEGGRYEWNYDDI